MLEITKQNLDDIINYVQNIPVPWIYSNSLLEKILKACQPKEVVNDDGGT